jgi:hypothetical protein
MQQEFLLAAILTAMALCAGGALVLSFLHWKGWKTEPLLPHLKAREADPPLPHQKAQKVDWRIEYEFNKVFMSLSKNGKEALIKRWTDSKNCDRQEAMRLAIEERRRDNR